MSEKLKQRLREHERREGGDLPFITRLRALVGEIESRFEGDERARLLRLAEETFERHVAVRGHTQRARGDLERLQRDQRRLAGILAALSTQQDGSTLH